MELIVSKGQNLCNFYTKLPIWAKIVIPSTIGVGSFLLYCFTPPKELNNRLDPIPENAVEIDNSFYDKTHFASTWWDEQKGWAAGLHKMNPIRADYFVSAFNKNFGEFSKSKKYLDIGCGGGILSEEIARRGFDVTGIDFSPSSIEAAKQHAAKMNLTNVKYIVGNAYSLPFEDESFDGVIMSDVLEHIHDLQKAIKEISRVLKPNGIFVFDTINRTLFSYIFIKQIGESRLLRFIPQHTHDWRLFIKPEELKSVLQKYHLSVIQDFKGLVLVPRGLSFTYGSSDTDTNGSYMGYAVKYAKHSYIV